RGGREPCEVDLRRRAGGGQAGLTPLDDPPERLPAGGELVAGALLVVDADLARPRSPDPEHEAIVDHPEFGTVVPPIEVSPEEHEVLERRGRIMDVRRGKVVAERSGRVSGGSRDDGAPPDVVLTLSDWIVLTHDDARTFGGTER